MAVSPFALGSAFTDSARAALGIAAKGLPAVRAALWGARLGAGRALDKATIERLGVEVVRDVSSAAKAEAVGAAAAIATAEPLGVAGLARTGARTAVIMGKDGVALKLTPLGTPSAVVSEGAVQTVARATTRTAFAGVARAARQGAVAGAVIDGAFGAVEAVRAVRAGKLERKEGVMLVGKRAARGAVVGGAGVAAAAVASAAVAATGIGIGAPVLVPLVAMAAAGVAVTRGFDRVFGE
ncbi:MAG TPA: hypothetical protein VL400_05475 [Polyangiaceae bacterium]|nr:hypothetical protein [Polyangiaceae bacterium]